MNNENVSRYVLNAYEYDDSEFQGPPRNLPRDEVFNLFGKINFKNCHKS